MVRGEQGEVESPEEHSREAAGDSGAILATEKGTAAQARSRDREKEERPASALVRQGARRAGGVLSTTVRAWMSLKASLATL